ncbi:YtxH domain-containing protein [Mucilaginibacter sp. RS28]|uniref:YtxH domain-containing protein n=1 Tax=Mucilaginibacter straminoryzae TaxID=2932774 RepID=A0A9X1X5T3_9SPHI|nr:YtxH domain-containing protein [Mucilaginibacter straminoryzae]MCJ8209164.1 YtxH domain-containing protein [Mucilaginibacter straminoryzae]
MKDQSKVIAALLIGAAAGAAIGLLLAPESGSELREDIADYVNDLFDKAKNQAQTTVDDIKQYSSNVVDKAKNKFSDIVGDATDLRDQAVDAAQGKVNDAKDAVKSTANEWNSSIQQS